MRLMELPQELVSLIFDHVGASELRKNVNYLLVSRRWYSRAQPIFLSGLDVTKVKLSASSLIKFPPPGKGSPLLSLIQKNAQQVCLRLLGHWWDSTTSRDSDDYHDMWYDTAEDIPNEEDNAPEADFTAADDNKEMDLWRKKVNAWIQDLALSLADFTSLQTLRLEFSAEDNESIGPFWNYIFDSTITTLLSNLPIHHNLTDLTIDICGLTSLIPSVGERHGITPIHICPLIAQFLPHLRKARIRLPCTCSAIFPTTASSSSKLETLILKLHQPFWEQRASMLRSTTDPSEPDSKSHGGEYCTLPCPSTTAVNPRLTPEDLHEPIYRAARRTRSSMPNLSMFRVSYAACRDGGMNIMGIDVLTDNTIYIPEEFFIYEDDGMPCWWEECDDRIAVGSNFTVHGH